MDQLCITSDEDKCGAFDDYYDLLTENLNAC